MRRRSAAAGTLLLAAAGAFATGLAAATGTARTLYVPTTASIHGNAGTFFHTDLWAFNRSSTAAITVTATYRCFAGSCGSAATGTFTLAPREARLITDVGTTLFARPETAGAVELSYQSATDDLAAATRTYTPSLPAPTNGTGIPALTIGDASARSVFLGLANNGGDLSSGFRSNAGAYNPATYSTHITLTLSRADGTVLGSTTRTLGRQAATQVNDIFQAVGAGALVETNAVLTAVSDTPVFPFVTVIDNQSGDSIWATALEDVPIGAATELVTNGGFDASIGLWSNIAPFIALSWVPYDAHGLPASGAVLVTNTLEQGGYGGNGARQCFSVAPGQALTFSGYARIAPGQRNGLASVVVSFYSTAACTGSSLSGVETNETGDTGAWVRLEGTGVVPANAQAAVVIAFVQKLESGGSLAVAFDEISVVRSSR